MQIIFSFLLLLFLTIPSFASVPQTQPAPAASSTTPTSKEQQTRGIIDQWKKSTIFSRLEKRAATPSIPAHNSTMPVALEEISKDISHYEALRIKHPCAIDPASPLTLQDYVYKLKKFRSQLIDKIAKATKEGINLAPIKENLRALYQSDSVSEFSGALEEAYTQGISGKGVKVLILDEPFCYHKDLAPYVVGSRTHSNPQEIIGHGSQVIGIIHQIAPGSPLELHNTSPTIQFLQECNPKFINLSSGMARNTGVNGKVTTILSHSNAILIQAAGNDAIALDHPLYGEQLFLHNLPKNQWEHLILVGNLTAGNIPQALSNFPGNSQEIQKNFIWTLGSDVFSTSKDNSYQRVIGTSIAAPVVTGSLALLAEKYPSLTPIELKECVLESAVQDFYMDTPEWIYGWHLTVHVAPGLVPSVRFLKGNIVQVEEPFDPTFWGKGILNLKRAFLYAELKTKNIPTAEIQRQLKANEDRAKDLLKRYLKTKHLSKAKETVTNNSDLERTFWLNVLGWQAKTYTCELATSWIYRTRLQSLQEACLKASRTYLNMLQSQWDITARGSLPGPVGTDLLCMANNLKQYDYINLFLNTLLTYLGKGITKKLPLAKFLEDFIPVQDKESSRCWTAIEPWIQDSAPEILQSAAPRSLEGLTILGLAERSGNPETTTLFLRLIFNAVMARCNALERIHPQQPLKNFDTSIVNFDLAPLKADQ